jgi:hypothetical protein
MTRASGHNHCFSYSEHGVHSAALLAPLACIAKKEKKSSTRFAPLAAAGDTVAPTPASRRRRLRTVRVSAPASPSSLSLPLSGHGPKHAHIRALHTANSAVPQPCGTAPRWGGLLLAAPQCLTLPRPHSAWLLLPPDQLRARERSDGGGDCSRQSPSGQCWHWSMVATAWLPLLNSTRR